MHADGQQVWQHDRQLREVPSRLVDDGYIYLAKNGGILSCLDAVTGKICYRKRLGVGGNLFASRMFRLFWSLRNSVVSALVGILSCGVLFADDPTDVEFFESDVLPILKERCYECHSHESNEANGGLVLDSRSGWAIGGDSGPTLVPGKPDKSLIVEAIRYANTDLQMPPDDKLSSEEIGLLEKWVAIGAPDTRVSDSTLSKVQVDIEAGRQHWAFQPIRQYAIPTVKDSKWPIDEVDCFLLARLEREGIRPAADADRYTWLRRVSLDLTGLPPSPSDVQAFIADESDDAFGRVVDRLLSSRAYGERWARHWLDLTGYADQIGTANNVFAQHAWRYREYLIDAFQSDKAFDTFIREQIAGDLLPGSVEQRAGAITATGFLLLGNIEIAESDKDQMRVDVVDQQVNKVGTAFLAMTVGCARCHDHKFDPIPQTDYYALAGIFQSTNSTHKIDRGVWSGVRVADLPETDAQKVDREARSKAYVKQLSAWKEERDDVRMKVDASKPDKAERKELESNIRRLNSWIQHAEYFPPSVRQAFAVGDVEKPRNMRITIRGNPHALGDVVPRGFLSVISGPSSRPSAGDTIPPGRSGRLELADWIASPENPLTARVIVNRIWQKLFGEGIVHSVDYFGVRGEKPSHPKLLDHLASRFVHVGWSQKKLIREIVLSRAYRMSGKHDDSAAAIDPDNRLLWRMSPRRLDAESIRDSLLAVTGTLQHSCGGPALALEYPENVSGLDPNDVNPPAFRLAKYYPGQKLRRTIYLPVIRSGAQPGPAELRNLFDFTQPAEISGQRAVTAVPTQALFLMNSDELKKYAADLASRTLAMEKSTTERIEQLWLLAYGRPATDTERVETGRFLQALSGDETAWTELCHAVLASNEFLMRL